MTRRSRSTRTCWRALPDQPKVWMSYGHVLKTVGRQADSIAAYRRAHRDRAGARRGLVEPRQSEDGRLRRRRHRRDGGRARRAGPQRGGPAPPPFRARQGARGSRRAPRPPSAIMPRATGSAAAQIHYDPDEIERPCPPQHRALHARFLRRPRRPGLPRARSDLHPRHAARGIDPDRADPRQPSARSKARWSCPTSPRSPSGSAAARPRPTPPPIPNAWPGSTRRRSPRSAADYLESTRIQRKTGQALFHRQDAEQLAARRADPADPAEREDHRRAPPSARLLLLQLQAAFRPRPGLHLRSGRARPLLSRLCDADGAFRRGPARPRPSRALRGDGRRSRSRGSRACSISSACPSIRPASNSTRTSAPCAPPAPSRSAARSTARASTSGAPSSPGSDR